MWWQFKVLKKNVQKYGSQKKRKKLSTPFWTLGEWHIFGCACLKHKCHILYAVQFTLQYNQIQLTEFVYFTVYNKVCPRYSVHSLYTVQFTLQCVPNRVYRFCILYSLQYSVYQIQCTSLVFQPMHNYALVSPIIL